MYITRFWGMGNSLGPFPDTSDWPKWPKWAFSVTYGLSNDHKMAKLVTLVLSMLETWFGCLFPGFVAWELLHTHTSYSDWPTWPKWPFMATQMTIKWINYNFGSEHARNVILVSIPRFCGMGNSLGPFSDTSDWPKWPKLPFSTIYGHSNDLTMAKLVTLGLSLLETWFWCLFLDTVAWEILCDHFQTPQNDLSGQNGYFRPFMATQITIKWPNFGSDFWAW